MLACEVEIAAGLARAICEQHGWPLELPEAEEMSDDEALAGDAGELA